jgi:hypothetical protein
MSVGRRLPSGVRVRQVAEVEQDLAIALWHVLSHRIPEQLVGRDADEPRELAEAENRDRTFPALVASKG